MGIPSVHIHGPSCPRNFSVVINHTPWRLERVACLEQMKAEFLKVMPDRDEPRPALINATDYRGTDWQVSKVKWALDQWEWSAAQNTDFHLFMTDDLHLAPGFVSILKAILEAAKHEDAIGFLSNHPRATEQRGHWYRTNSWLVGPCYAISHKLLTEFLPWFKSKPDGNAPGAKGYGNDDSTLNEFITQSGRSTVHPIPTIIEHRADIDSTVGHGDKYSRERISWRSVRSVTTAPDGSFAWVNRPVSMPQGMSMESLLDEMKDPAWWGDPKDSPLLPVGE